MSGSMNWTKILGDAGIAEPIGYHEAVKAANEAILLRYRTQGKKRAKGSNTRKADQVSRKKLQAKERSRFPSLKHGAD